MKLSVIIPTFNRAHLLSEAINSILSQPFSIHEIIIIDDASTDSTQKLCHDLQLNGLKSDIILIRNSTNLGAQVSRNRGLLSSTGDAILFMDSDDILAEKGVMLIMRELENSPSLDYVYGKVLMTDSKLVPLENSPPVGSCFTLIPAEIAGYHWHTMGAIYRKTYLQKVGLWDESLTGSQDWEFQARVKLTGGKGKFIDHTIGFWRDHNENRVGTKNFRYDYVKSTVNACILIRDKAREVGMLDTYLERRLAKKILIHALEFAVHGYREERCKSLLHAVETLQQNLMMQITLRFWQSLSSNFDVLAWKIIHLKESSFTR